MVALPVAPGVLELSFRSRSSTVSHDFVNKVHYHYAGAAPTVANLDTMAPTLLVAWAAQFGPLMQVTMSVEGIKIIDLSSPSGAQTELLGHTAGTLAGGLLPADLCLVMAAKIARRYRGGHPRLYLPLGSSGVLNNARTWEAAHVTNAVTAMIAFNAAAIGAGWAGAGVITPCNVSYFLGYTNEVIVGHRARAVPNLRVGGPITDTITGWVGRAQVGTQRRRIAA